MIKVWLLGTVILLFALLEGFSLWKTFLLVGLLSTGTSGLRTFLAYTAGLALTEVPLAFVWF